MSKAVLITLPVLLIGGTEIQTLNLVNVLVSSGYNVTVCCYHEYDQNMVARFEAAGTRVILLKYERAKGLWYLAKGLLRIFRKVTPDIVHVQYVAPGFIPIIAAKLAGIRTVFATVHQPGSVYGLKAKILLRSAARFCTAFFCVSRAVEESWFGSSELFDRDRMDGKRNHFTIYNAVDTDRIKRIIGACDKEMLRKKLQLGRGPVIGFVGRLRHEKGPDILIDAFPHILQSLPEAVLVVVGDGPDRTSLKLKAKTLDLEKNILWLGQKSPDEVYQLYSIMDVVVVPSRFEGFGLSTAEAMAAGVPVVVSRVDGLSELVQDGVNGYLVGAGDTHGLAQAVMHLLSDSSKAKEMGAKGHESVKEKFSIRGFNHSISAVYNEYGKT